MQDLEWVAFHCRDWLASRRVALMTAEERGVYVHLLAWAWIEDGLPDDLQELARLAGVPAITERVLTAFPVAADGRRRNPRQEHERSRARQRSHGARKGASARWNNASAYHETGLPGHAKADADANAMRSHCDRNADALRTQCYEHTTDRDTEENNPPLPPRGGESAAPTVSPDQAKPTKREPVAFPGELDTPAFRAAWEDLLAYRRECRLRPWAARTIRANLALWATWGEKAAIEAIRTTIRCGWQGVFFPGSITGPGARSSAPDTKPRHLAQPDDAKAVERAWTAKHRTVVEVDVPGIGKVSAPGLDQPYPGYAAAKAELTGGQTPIHSAQAPSAKEPHARDPGT
jgi:uncharacterized protein YdaU (DUF1376 family)